jgi:RNA polymerase sigma-70 factor (ECF subfamily)
MHKGTNPAAALSYKARNGKASGLDDDAALISSIRRGDLNAFEILVNRHQTRMLNISLHLIGNFDDACEVVQDAFLSAYKNLESFRGESKFTTWLTAITVNLSKNRLKQTRSRQSHEAFSINAPLPSVGGDMVLDPPSKEQSALLKLEHREVQLQVRDCIKALDEDFRDILVLRDLQDFSYDEIGSMLNIREGTVKSRLFRAREMVKDCLKRVIGEL